jgi:hypothetical protein
MFDKSKIGHSFPAFTIEVERCKIHELALAIGDSNAIYHRRAAAQEADYKDVPLFPTAPTLFGFWSDSQRSSELSKIGINVMRILHGEEEYEYLAPIYPGDTLTGITTVVDGKTRKGSGGASMDIVSTETSYSNQQNEPVLKARTTIVVRE